MDKDEKRKFWRKLLGYKIGEKVTITYEIPSTYEVPRRKTDGNIVDVKMIGVAEVFLSGTIVGFKRDTLVLQTADKVRINLDEKRILDARVASKEDQKDLRLRWGESLESYLKRTYKSK